MKPLYAYRQCDAQDLLNRITNAKECDATDASWYNKCRVQKNYHLYFTCIIIFTRMNHHFKRIVFFTVFVICCKFSGAQNYSNNYPQGYFRSPLDIPLQLVANFGALRTNHYHMGLDIRTQGRENLPVYAAAEGYVSRIKIETYGFGNAIYITHPNGYTTLYAHLNSFFPALAAYIKAKQYKDNSWAQDFEIPADLFPVTKGKFIANSGNTGGSAGPHVHFEIRDSKTGNNLNPQLFGLNTIDNQPPVIKNLFWYDRRFSTYQMAGKSIGIAKKNSVYTAVEKLVKVNSPVISLGISTEDISQSTPFKLGIYSTELWLDDSLLNASKIDNISYDETRYMNAAIDYSKFIKEKKYVQYLAKLPGNKLNLFDDEAGYGVIILADTIVHHIKILVKDAVGNISTLQFALQLKETLANHTYPVNAQALVPNQLSTVNGKNVKVDFSKNAFYDAVPFVLTETFNNNKNNASALIGLHNYTVPVHDAYTVELKTTLAANNPLRNNVVMQLTSGTNKQTMKGTWAGEWMTAGFNRLGNVQLLIDTVPPVITPVGWKNNAILTAAKKLTIKCKDDLDDIASFSAELDGDWLLFTNSKDNFTYTFDEHCTKGLHRLTVTVTDIAGNTSEQIFTFTK